MRLSIRHQTDYRYESPQAYTLQRIRLMPRRDGGHTVESWSIDIEGARKEVVFRDHFDNETWLLSTAGEPHSISIVAHGVVNTSDTHGVVDSSTIPAPDWLFLRQGELTEPDEALRALAEELDGNDTLSRLHVLMEKLQETMHFETGTTATATRAGEAWAQQRGVCQDYAHVFCSVAREAGIPARYVSGYLMMNDRIEQVASHAWAEAKVEGLGWVGFDAANGISPDERYVRLALGLDYRDAAPVSGIRHGGGSEQLDVFLSVEQQ